MTTIAHPIRRETASFYRGCALVVELHPRTISIRQKGKRDRLEVDYVALLEFAYKIRFRALQDEKREKLQRRSA